MHWNVRCIGQINGILLKKNVSIGLLTRKKSELQMQAAVRDKVRNDLNNEQQICAIRAEEVRKLEVEKVTLEMDKEVLGREKAELQQQVSVVSKQ